MIFEDACSFHSQFGRISLLSTAKSWYSLEKWVELVDQTWCSHLWSIWQRVGDGQSMKLHGTSIHVSSYPCWFYTLTNLAPFWMGSEWCPTRFRCVRAAHDIFRFQILIIVYSYMIYPLYIFVFTYKNIRYIYFTYMLQHTIALQIIFLFLLDTFNFDGTVSYILSALPAHGVADVSGKVVVVQSGQWHGPWMV